MLQPSWSVTLGQVGRHQVSRRPGLLREAPRFRWLWLSRTISSAGTGVSRVALVLLVTPSGPAAVSAVLLAATLPALAGPLAGAIADRVDQRRLLAGCELGQGTIFGLIAVFSPPLPVLLPMVALGGLLAALFMPAGKSSVPRLVAADRLPRANALLGTALNLQIMVGPAVGGALVGLAGPAAAFGLNAASFGISALLLTRLGPLPPEPAAAGGPASLLGQTWAGLRYSVTAPVPRALVAATACFVAFAAIDNVALVFLVRRALHGTAAEYGLITAAFGTGMLAASALLSWLGARRPPVYWLVTGYLTGAAGTIGTGLAPGPVVAAAAQITAGAGNTADVVGIDTLVQQVVPGPLLGRVFGAVGTCAQAGSAVAYALGGPLVALTGARASFLIAGLGMLAGLPLLWPAIRVARCGSGPVTPAAPLLAAPGPGTPGPERRPG